MEMTLQFQDKELQQSLLLVEVVEVTLVLQGLREVQADQVVVAVLILEQVEQELLIKVLLEELVQQVAQDNKVLVVAEVPLLLVAQEIVQKLEMVALVYLHQLQVHLSLEVVAVVEKVMIIYLVEQVELVAVELVVLLIVMLLEQLEQLTQVVVEVDHTMLPEHLAEVA